mmetsp:Transcript_50055/g.154656  ORF Transcript_50055/g.154656 Transcript_50055/m.154656 type:complete len:377 (+) Transcript_50055:304-1434(+)
MCHLRVESGKHVIQQHQFGVCRVGSPGKGHALPLTAAQHGTIHTGSLVHTGFPPARVSMQAARGKHSVHTGSIVFTMEGDVRGDGTVENPRRLRCIAQRRERADCTGGVGIGRHGTEELSKKRRLAGSRGARDAYETAAAYTDFHIMKHRMKLESRRRGLFRFPTALLVARQLVGGLLRCLLLDEHSPRTLNSGCNHRIFRVIRRVVVSIKQRLNTLENESTFHEIHRGSRQVRERHAQHVQQPHCGENGGWRQGFVRASNAQGHARQHHGRNGEESEVDGVHARGLGEQHFFGTPELKDPLLHRVFPHVRLHHAQRRNSRTRHACPGVDRRHRRHLDLLQPAHDDELLRHEQEQENEGQEGTPSDNEEENQQRCQ